MEHEILEKTVEKKKKITLLYVDDEINNLISFKAAFRMKYKIFTAISANEAFEILDKEEIEIIITDQRMPNITGVEFLEKVLVSHPDPIRILLTGFTDMEAVIAAINIGKIFQYLTKPWVEEELLLTIESAYAKYLAQLELKKSNDTLSSTNNQLEFLLRQKLLS